MVFPQTELPIFVDIAPGASPMGTTDSWDQYWVDITKDVRVGQKIVVEEGVPDEANQADPGSCSLTLNMGASKVASTLGQYGCYSTRNPLGPYWGALAKNTPLRVRLQRMRDTFNRTTGPGWGTSDNGITYSVQSAFYSTDGSGRGIVAIASNFTTSTTMVNAGAWDFDMTYKVSLNVLPTNVANADVVQYVNFRKANNSNQYQLQVNWTPAGTISLFFTRVIAGVSTTLVGVTTAILGTITANTQYAVRLKVEGGFLSAKIWLASGAEPLAYNMTFTDSAYTLDNSLLGTNIQLQTTRFSGNVGTTAIYWADFKVNQYPFIGAVPEWPIRWDQSGNDSTAPLKATGVLRRLQQGKNPVKSPLYSFMDGLKPAALWTLEDDSGATLVSSQTSGVKGGTIYSSTPAGWQTPRLGGTASQYSIAIDTTLAFTFPKMTITDRWLSWFTFYMPVLPVAGADALVYRIRSAGTIVQWDVKISQSFGGIIFLQGSDASGSVLINFSLTYVPGEWVLGQVEIQATGSTMTGRLVTYGFGTGAVRGSTSSAITGTIGVPNAASLFGSTGFQVGGLGPVAVYPTIPSVNIANLQLAGNGFVGEDAGARSARLAAEKGIRLDLVSGGRSSLMGIQNSDTFLNIMGENAVTDIGLLTEFRGGLRYRTRGRRYNQSARMALDFAAGHIKTPPEPTDDDQRLRNDITVNRTNGSSARAYDSGSIATNGLYDTETDVNTASDNDLPGQAGYRLYLGTWDEMRWPSLVLDLARNAGITNFIERATALDAGAYVTLANPPSNLPVGTLDLLVEGTKTTFGPYEWTIELVCQPYAPWRITDSSNTTNRIPRMDLVGSTLGSAEAATALLATDTWTITNAGRSWNAAQVPFNWNVNGEVVTVTALTGTSSQTATVTRGVNGISKAHIVGEAIVLNEPLYIAL